MVVSILSLYRSGSGLNYLMNAVLVGASLWMATTRFDRLAFQRLINCVCKKAWTARLFFSNKKNFLPFLPRFYFWVLYQIYFPLYRPIFQTTKSDFFFTPPPDRTNCPHPAAKSFIDYPIPNQAPPIHSSHAVFYLYSNARLLMFIKILCFQCHLHPTTASA